MIRLISNKWALAGLSSALILASVAACATGPVFEEHLFYTPPPETEGRQCARDCQETLNQCQRVDDLEQRLCRQEADTAAERDYNRAMDRYTADLERHLDDPEAYPRPSEPSRYFYQASYGHCTQRGNCLVNFNICYQTCGGIITSKTVCVRNCETAAR